MSSVRDVCTCVLLLSLPACQGCRNALVCEPLPLEPLQKRGLFKDEAVSYKINLSADYKAHTNSSASRITYEVPLGTFVKIEAVSEQPVRVHWHVTGAQDVGAAHTDQTWQARYVGTDKCAMEIRGETEHCTGPTYHVVWINPLVEALKDGSLTFQIRRLDDVSIEIKEGVPGNPDDAYQEQLESMGKISAGGISTEFHRIDRSARGRGYIICLKCSLHVVNDSNKTINTSDFKLQVCSSQAEEARSSPLSPVEIAPKKTATVFVEVNNVFFPENDAPSNLYWCVSQKDYNTPMPSASTPASACLGVSSGISGAIQFDKKGPSEPKGLLPHWWNAPLWPNEHDPNCPVCNPTS